MRGWCRPGLVTLALALTGCDTLYHAQQASARTACEKLPNPQDMRACLQQNPDRYDQYQKQREALRPGPANQPLDAR